MFLPQTHKFYSFQVATLPESIWITRKGGKKMEVVSFKQGLWIMSHSTWIYFDINQELMQS